MSRINLFGCKLDAVTMDQTVERIAIAIHQRKRITHAALNTAKLISMRQDPELYRDVSTADLVTADGMGILLASRLAGQPLTERVTGIDLMERVLILCAKNGFRPYILGARQEVLDAAVYRIRLKHPELSLAGVRHGYFTPGDETTIIAEINASNADCVFVGVPTPMKERFIARNRHQLNAAFVMGVGGSIDVLAGHVQRAPSWMQRAGLEWLFRLLQEPRRMWRRYLVTNTKFLGWLLTATFYRAIGKAFVPLSELPASR